MCWLFSEPDEATKLAALKALRGKLRFWNSTAAWIYQPRGHVLDMEQRTIGELRAWINTVTDRQVRAAYAGWVDFAQHGLDEARVEMKTQSIAREQSKYRAACDAEQDAALKRLRDLPRP